MAEATALPLSTRVALAYLFLTGLVVAVWASAFPAGFYAAFPGFGRVWVAVDGPYNEHLIRDAGAAYAMIAALTGLGLVRPRLASPFAVGLATLAFNLLHAAYHLTHLAMFGPLDRVLDARALLGAVAASVWLMLPAVQLARKGVTA